MIATDNFLVIDTEGGDELSEIAVIDDRGRVIYGAYNSQHPDQQDIKVTSYPLAKIIHDFYQLAQGKTLVFHSASHDIGVLKRSFEKVNRPWFEHYQSCCTVQLSVQYFPQYDSYSLDYLSRALNLRVAHQYFNSMLAHSARYDAEFTYQLYRKIMTQASLQFSLKKQPNPFSSSRVDTPFQHHPDLKEIYGDQFKTLKSALLDINEDPNHQSNGVVVIGEPGAGKTHLMMRLAKEFLKTNRLLFIRQPNNAETVLFHIYSRILESLVESVPGSQFNQLQYLIANSVISFCREENIGGPIVEKCQDDPLQLFAVMGGSGTKARRDNWDRLIKQIQPWWTRKYAAASYSWRILKGFLQYCRYTDENYRAIIARWLAGGSLDDEDLEKVNLERWDDDLSREAFSLEAMAVLSKLSLLDEPLIIVFDQLEGLGRKQNKILLENFGEAVKEIFTHVPNSLIIFNLFPERWVQMRDEIFDAAIVDRMSQYIVHLECPNEKQLHAILQSKLNRAHLKLDELFDNRELNDILSQPSIRSVINRAAAYHRFKRDGVPLPNDYRKADKPGKRTNSDDETSTNARLDILEADVRTIKQLISALISPTAYQVLLNSKGHPASNHLIPANRDEDKPIGTAAIDIDSDDGALVINTQDEPAAHGVDVVDSDTITFEGYLEQKQKELEDKYDKPTIIDDTDDIGKLIAIATEIQNFERFDMRPLRLGKLKLPEHVLIENTQSGFILAFLHHSGNKFTSRIKNFNQLVISKKHLHFTLMRDARENTITGKVGKTEINRLNHADNGSFLVLDRSLRLQFELLNCIISDIQNRDLEIGVEKAISLLRKYQPENWLLEKLLR